MEKKLFGTDGIRGKANVYPMTPEIALRLGKAIVKVLGKGMQKPKFVIGKDTRLSGYMFETAITSGISSMGGRTFLVGPLPTPAIAHLTRSLCAEAGIVISASHNPSDDNGIKIFDKYGYKLSDEMEIEIEKLMLSDEINSSHPKSNIIGKAFRIDDASGRYIEFAKSTIKENSLNGLKVVLDCANGAAYKVAPYIFSELGAEIIVLNNEPNGSNINYNCGALHPEVIKKAVLQNNADLGIALDGDADRLIVVDEKGNEVDGDYIIAIAALEMKKEKLLNKNTVVVTVYSNLAFDKLMEKNGIKVIRADNGDRYVIEEMKKNGLNLGGEFSGHIILADYNTTGDGIISGLQLMGIMKKTGKKLSELASVLKKYPQVIVNVKVREKKPLGEIKTVQDLIKEKERLLKGKGRIFVRYSGTEMIARVMVEGEDKERTKIIADDIAEKIKEEAGM